MNRTSLRRTALYEAHEALGAKLVEFGGYEMPLSYPQGTVAEHLACRNDAVVFDVSHLGTVRVTGAAAFETLQRTLSNDLDKIEVGRAQYTHLCNERGGVLDDIIVWWLARDRFDVMPNASNTQRVRDAIGGTDVTEDRTVLAVQGPTARERVARIAPTAASVPRFGVTVAIVAGHPACVAGTGYSGEDGIEIAIDNAHAKEVFDALLGCGVIPAGLGARDTLRLEAALPLHGHELTPEISPIEAGLSWVVGWDKPAFAGRDALIAEREAGPTRRLRGFATTTRQPPRDGARVLLGGTDVGVITSGNFSPVLEHGIALGLVDATTGPQVGDDVQLEVRGRLLDAACVALPFVKKHS